MQNAKTRRVRKNVHLLSIECFLHMTVCGFSTVSAAVPVDASCLNIRPQPDDDNRVSITVIPGQQAAAVCSCEAEPPADVVWSARGVPVASGITSASLSSDCALTPTLFTCWAENSINGVTYMAVAKVIITFVTRITAPQSVMTDSQPMKTQHWRKVTSDASSLHQQQERILQAVKPVRNNTYSCQQKIS
jgi:hypothetical protein